MRALYDSKSRTIDDLGIKKLLTKEAKYQSWLDVEIALAKAQGKLGVIPKEEADNIEKYCKLENLDFELMDRIYQKIGHGFMPFLKVMIKAAGEEAGKYIHYGITTQNVQQTAQLLTIKKINTKIYELIEKILSNLCKMAMENKDAVLPGRTHGQHALPITYGYKVSVWIEELLTSLERLKESEKRVVTVMMGGAVGAYNSVGEVGKKVQDEVADILEMSSMEVPSRNMCTHKVEYIMNLSLLVSTAHKMAEEVYYTSGSEYGEVAEGFIPGTIGSSTMPQKVNPKLSKGIIANSQKLYSLITPLLYSAPRMFEGDSSSYMLYDGVVEESLELVAEILPRFEELTRTLYVSRKDLLKNAMLTNGMINSEYIMMMLSKKLGKDRSHEIVYNLVMLSKGEDTNYIDFLMRDENISKTFSKEEIKGMLNPSNYTGEGERITEKTVSRCKKILLKLK